MYVVPVWILGVIAFAVVFMITALMVSYYRSARIEKETERFWEGS